MLFRSQGICFTASTLTLPPSRLHLHFICSSTSILLPNCTLSPIYDIRYTATMSSPDERNVKRAREFLSLQHFSALQLADGVCVIATTRKVSICHHHHPPLPNKHHNICPPAISLLFPFPIKSSFESNLQKAFNSTHKTLQHVR